MRLLVLALLAAGLAGCKTPAEARYVARTADHGVIAMPVDTPENRARAEALMRSHFPEGYEIVWEGEEAVVVPPPRHVGGFEDPRAVHRRRMADPALAAAYEPGFQQAVEDLPGTPQAMKGYARPPAPAVGVHVGDPPPHVAGVVANEWRITYKRLGPVVPAGAAGGSESLYPAYHRDDAPPAP